MIKFVSRPNIIYIIQLIIWNVLRKIEKTIISEVFEFNDSPLFSLLMFIGEFLAGLIISRYQKHSFTKKKVILEPKGSKSLELIQNEIKITFHDKVVKLYLLIFFASFFDFVGFTLSVSYLSKFYNISSSLESRLSGILTISSALFFYYLLKLPIYRHQFLSLLIIGICLVLIIGTEFIFQEVNIFLSYGKFVIALVIIFLIHFYNSLIDSIEKYLFEYNYFNPFIVLMWEGVFGIIITLIYCSIENYFNELIYYYKSKTVGRFIGLILLLFLYIILSGGRNAFRVITNKVYSPITKTLTDYLLNPLYIIIDFSRKKDFLKGKDRNVLYFILNLILSFIITICGCVYNEFIVLFFCKLEYNTHYGIAKRSLSNMNIMIEMENNNDDNDDN